MQYTKNKENTDTSRTAVLVHGFFRSGRDMRYLARKLKEMGYKVFVPTLPTIFRNVRECGELLAKMIEENVPQDDGIMHFVGHSMGGLIIRYYLSRNVVKGLGRVVMMGTPNGGSPYANLLLKFPFSGHIMKALHDLAEPGLDIPLPQNVPAPEVGIVIGKTDILRKYLLRGDHDGLVKAESVRCIDAKDTIIVPYRHESIHWRPDTAKAVASFFETGSFKSSLLLKHIDV